MAKKILVIEPFRNKVEPTHWLKGANEKSQRWAKND